MSYYFSKRLAVPFGEAVEKVSAALKEAGFGILTEIDVKATMKKKLDVDFRRYCILGACNPRLAFRALQAEANVGLLLPCNVVVQETSSGAVEVSAIDPVVAMQGAENPELAKVADEVRGKLHKVLVPCPAVFFVCQVILPMIEGS